MEHPARHERNGSRKLAQGNPGSNDLSFLEHQGLKMDRRKLLSQAGDDHSSGRANHLDRLRNGRFAPWHLVEVADALNHAIDSQTVRNLHHPFDRVFVFQVNCNLRAKLARGLQPEGLHINGNHRVGHTFTRGCTSCMAEHIHHRQAQLTGAQDRNRLARLDHAAPQDMTGQTVHFNHGYVLHIEVIRQGKDMTGRSDHVLAKAAVIFDPQQGQLAAGVGMAGQAGGAFVTGNNRIHRHPVAALETFHVLAHF